MSDKSVIRVKKIICEECNGEGAYHHFAKCLNCDGTGEVAPYERLYGETFKGERCPDCKPTAEVWTMPEHKDGLVYEGYKACARCHGTGCYYIETNDLKNATAILASVI